MNIMTINNLVITIRSQDKSSAINANMLRELFDKRVLPFWKHGNRTVCDISILIKGINNLLGLGESNTIPRIRSIHNAYLELREINPQLGISEERIRFLVVKQKLPHVKIGNRAYVALECFEPPYNECLIYDDSVDSTEAEIERIVREQFERSMKNRRDKH